MRTFVFTMFVMTTISALFTLLKLAWIEEKKWASLLDFIVEGGVSIWAAWLLWR